MVPAIVLASRTAATENKSFLARLFIPTLVVMSVSTSHADITYNDIVLPNKRARSKITRQFPLILNQAGDLTNCSIPNSQFSSEVAVGLGTIRFFRMRIENWELRIGQILPILHPAKLFLREP